MALLYLDIDNFKSVNDTLGHERGDECLKNIASSVSDMLREDENLFRVGGDEFCIIVPDYLAENELETLSKRIISIIKNEKTCSDYGIQISCSIGIALFKEKSQTLDQIMRSADSAMYKIKNGNKDGFGFFE